MIETIWNFLGFNASSFQVSAEVEHLPDIQTFPGSHHQKLADPNRMKTGQNYIENDKPGLSFSNC